MTGHRDIIDQLVTARHQAGLTQRQVAARCYVSTSSIGQFETTHHRSPTLATVLRYAAAVGATITITTGDGQ
ncbi:MAG TPA: helix-turn-helix transcriptional regulator [Candidatus Saccharimonadales bacterium]|nr:helix-turn-helix transcriptional regulator [Candidatus Saccharimonadales bacterium]